MTVVHTDVEVVQFTFNLTYNDRGEVEALSKDYIRMTDGQLAICGAYAPSKEEAIQKAIAYLLDLFSKGAHYA